jgi:formamidopyrimidine-DNA glycosylase
MPELPDITVYVERIGALFGSQTLQGVRIASPFLLRTVEPPATAAVGRRLVGTRRLGKRVVLVFEGELSFVFHLMVAGRWHLRRAGERVPARVGLAVLDFETATLVLTEAGGKRRASLHVVQGEDALAALDPGGLEVLEASSEAFCSALRRERHTLKRALTDPRLFSGIGNAYSDEILHRAALSPLAMSDRLTTDEVGRLYAATRATLVEWIERLRAEVGDGFPEKVTAFRGEMAVHGRFRQPCRACGTEIQRIAYATNEANYCPRCQTGGRLLADRAFSRLLKDDWPRTIEELEHRRNAC